MEPRFMSCWWLTALAALRQLCYIGDGYDRAIDGKATCAPNMLPCQLSSIVTVSLTSFIFLSDAYLVEVCMAILRLRSLRLSGDRNIRFASVLGCVPCTG
jgi:hypothetical protein